MHVHVMVYPSELNFGVQFIQVEASRITRYCLLDDLKENVHRVLYIVCTRLLQ
jgi:hypothetical protein